MQSEGLIKELLPPERREELEQHPVVMELLDYTLVRDPSRRVTLHNLIMRTAAAVRAAAGADPCSD
eukprot:scaffold143274_cov28-Prasinocladus_malaysianus.AAC.1